MNVKWELKVVPWISLVGPAAFVLFLLGLQYGPAEHPNPLLVAVMASGLAFPPLAVLLGGMTLAIERDAPRLFRRWLMLGVCLSSAVFLCQGWFFFIFLMIGGGT